MPEISSRIWAAEPQQILFAGDGPGPASTASGNCSWRVSNPAGMRCYVATGVAFRPQNATGAIPNAAECPSLWIAEAQQVFPDADRAFPIENVIATSAAPLQIPTDTALFGKMVALQSAADWVRGFLSWTSSVGGARTGTWWAFAKWWAAVDMCDAEWQLYRGRMQLIVEAGQPGNQSVT
jgi:hypothetical protein